MMKHPVDGGEMLRRRLELPLLAAVVAFEHHLRVDGTGYPGGVARPVAEPRDPAVQHRRRLRRDAVPAQLPEGLPDRPHPRRYSSTTTGRVSTSASCGVSASCWGSTLPATSSASTTGRWRWCCASTRPTLRDRWSG
ncbi:MAG: hypothetical protein MZU95_14685 [Desulfomicrobium escambiense]|nr:hypothetical protein [Desulfomicrobium escambiense]